MQTVTGLRSPRNGRCNLNTRVPLPLKLNALFMNVPLIEYISAELGAVAAVGVEPLERQRHRKPPQMKPFVIDEPKSTPSTVRPPGFQDE
jgi:hypothetical protein